MQGSISASLNRLILWKMSSIMSFACAVTMLMWVLFLFLKKIVVTKDIVAPYYDEYGILTINIYDFLLNPRSLES